MKQYTYEQAVEQSTQYFGNDYSAAVYVDKYALRDNDGYILEPTPDLLHDRLAKEFARIDSEKYKLNYDERFTIYRNAIDKFARIVPQGSPMAAIGNPYQVMSASNCVVIASPKDSMGGIFKSAEELAQLAKRRCGVGIDLSTLRPEGTRVNNAAKTTSGAWSFADFYSFVTRMVGQCIARGEKVLTRDGLKNIENVLPNKDYVWTKNGWIKVNTVFVNGKKQIFEITTKEGYVIKTSQDHIFLTENNGNLVEKRLKDFIVGDSIITIPGTKVEKEYQKLTQSKYIRSNYNNSNRLNTNIILPNNLDEKLAYIIGYSYGDGSIEKDKYNQPCSMSLACSNAFPEIKIKLIEYYKDLFNYNAHINSADGDLETVDIHSTTIMRFLDQNNILKEKAEHIKLPKIIFDSKSSVQAAFIAGFFDADGSVTASKKMYRCVSINKQFIEDLQTILMANGIISKTSTEDRSNKNWHNLHCISISGSVAQQRLVQFMGEFSSKIAKHNIVIHRDNNLTPYKASTLGVSHSKFGYIPDNTQYLSSAAYLKVIQEPDVSGLGNLLIKSQIISIEKAGYEDTYDLSLDSEHLFWCEGFYVHNSGRRGALMITLDVHHPDVESFATSKHDITKVTGANISVRLSNKFLQAVEDDTEYEQYWPLEGQAKIKRFVRARQVWNTIVESATKTADPGLIIWDNLIDTLPAHSYKAYKTISTNPCSEIGLSAFDSCRLISINLTGYVKNAFEDESKFDFSLFKSDIAIAMQMADNLVDLELELITKIKASCEEESEKELWGKLYKAGKDGRRTGLGTHGLADTLAQLKIKYDTDDAVEIVSKIYKTLRDVAYDTSCELAKVRGPFPAFDYEIEKDCIFIKKLPISIKEKLATTGRRNISILTQAPTGSVSSVSKVGQFNSYNVSSGIEPVFRNIYTRRKKINANEITARVDFTDDVGDKWQEYKMASANVQAYLDKNELNIDKAKLPSYFITSDQINWMKRIELQGEEQKFLDHSISSTINLPAGTTSDVVGKIYLAAWKAGLKGITVYVEGSKSGVLLSNDKSTKRPDNITSVMAPKRPNELPCDIKKAKINGENWTIFVGLLHDKPYEVFGGLSKYVDIPNKYKRGKIAKNGKIDGIATYNLIVGEGEDQMIIKDIANVFDNANYGAFTRTLSLSLRHGVSPQYVVEQLQKDKNSDITSFSKVMGRVLKSYIKDGTKSSDKTCPECSKEGSLIYESGCVRCLSCAFSKCG